MKKKNILIAFTVAAVLVTAFTITALVVAGRHFVGPLKGLVVNRITSDYPVYSNQGEVVFYGASNFALWTNMEADLTGFKVQNHGFGGSTDKDLVSYADKLLYPYNPTVVFFQTGSNDYVNLEGTDEEKLEQCMAYKKEMYDTFHEKLPDTVFVVMSGLLLPGRSEYAKLTMVINRQLESLCNEREYMIFVDASKMTYYSEVFNEAIFKDDGIHLNHEGQILWANDYIIPALEKVDELLVPTGRTIRAIAE